MLSRLTAHGRGVPNLVVARRVVDKMVAAAARYTEDETGEAMVGLVIPGTHTGVPTLYVLDTISPDESAVRQMHTFQQGDERQDELIWWLQENWRLEREKQRAEQPGAQAKWDVPLRYVGDWHKQPGYMIQPSGGDLMTALDWIEDPANNTDFLLAPIVTLDHDPTTSMDQGNVNFLTVPQGNGLNARIDFWYIDRHMRVFAPVVPAVYPDNQLPSLAEYPWHLVNEDRFLTESAQLSGEKLFTTLVLWDADGAPPLEACFLTARMGWDKVMLLVTPYNYPKAPPSMRVAPYAPVAERDDAYEAFSELWAVSEPVPDPPGWAWAEDKYLIDYVQAVEAALGLRAADTDAAKPSGEEMPDELGQS
jgi:hypothetical protein